MRCRPLSLAVCGAIANGVPATETSSSGWQQAHVQVRVVRHSRQQKQVLPRRHRWL
jgi:hypothetical protein